DHVGLITVKVTATDGSDVSVSDEFTLTVANTNDDPTVANPIDDQSTDEDAPFTFQVPADTFADIDVGDTLTLTATLANGDPLPGWLSFDPATGTFSGTPENDHVGLITVKVTATDGSDVSVSDEFTLTVDNTNDDPTVANPIDDQSTDEDAPFTFQVPADTFADIDVGDTLTLSATLVNGDPLPGWLSFDPATKTFTGTPLNGHVGTITVKVTATDGSDVSVSDEFTLTVANTNDAPTVATPIVDQTANEDEAFSFTVPTGTFDDVDVGDSLTLSATLPNGDPLPTWLTFNPETGTFSGTPENGDVGTITVKVTATDGSDVSVSDEFTLTVNNTNDAPVFTSAAAVSVSENGMAAYTAVATDVDAGTTLTYTLSGDDAGLFDIDANSGVVTFKVAPDFEDPKDADGDNAYQIIVTADDGTNTTSQAVTITVTDVLEVIAGSGDDDTLVGGVGDDAIDAGGGDDKLDGGEGDDILRGGAGNDILRGGLGFDILVGGDGDDTYHLEDEDDVVVDTAGNDTITSTISRSLANYTGIENLTLLGSAAINGTGNSGDNVITGNDADNVLNGGGGKDTLIGLGGNDTYITDGDDTIVEAANAGIDTVQSSVSFTLGANLENLILTGSKALNGTGNALDNVITGNNAANVLNGGGGKDTLIGHGGNDTYITDGGDTIVEAANGGIDTVQSSVSLTLGANLENLILTGSALNGTGNGLANVITGNRGANKLDGGAGNDTLKGDAGNDTLNGGLGKDILTGGTGKDVFVFNTKPASTNIDTITDFSVKDDTIHLENGVFTALTKVGKLSAAAFAKNTSGLAADKDDRVIYETDTGKLFYDADGNGKGKGVHFATLTKNLALTADDFFII
ncbi:Ca2+-binding RTX toxin-like protein, partial [Mycoplana sp. BE70]|uniref:putative Ig domain-containing protein n=1 Tax=Mycoplana sp. BE70 TaxID=2817775 RepID=UPI002861DF39